MLDWLRIRLFRQRSTLLPADLAPAADVRPVWVDELVELLQKQTRSAAKQAARLEALLEERDEQLREALAVLRERAAPPPRDADSAPEELFDALDSLDEARTHAAEPHLREGLLRVQARIANYCERLGYTRLGAVGGAVDARAMRVVGTQTAGDLPAGAIVRVVRAAIVSAGELVREGHVITNVEAVRDEPHLGN